MLNQPQIQPPVHITEPLPIYTLPTYPMAATTTSILKNLLTHPDFHLTNILNPLPLIQLNPRTIFPNQPVPPFLVKLLIVAFQNRLNVP